MPIDPLAETLITLSAAAKLLPRRRAGRAVHVATMYRWTKIGCRGIVLESTQVGGTRCTSREALRRFMTRLTELGRPTPAAGFIANARVSPAVDRRLDELGL